MTTSMQSRTAAATDAATDAAKRFARFTVRSLASAILAAASLAPLAHAASPGGGGLLAKWCEAKPGDTRQALLALMGKPATSLDTQMSWQAPPLRFTAFFDGSGSVKQLDINTREISAAEIEALPCRPTRTRRGMALAAAAKKPRTPACQLVSAPEMSAILGTAVVGKADERPGVSTQCTYRSSAGTGPSVELKLTWGDGAAAMQGLGLAGKREPGLVSPYDGIGDQAGVAGPLLLIRAGDDLVTMVFNGVTGTPAKAKRIFDTAKARM